MLQRDIFLAGEGKAWLERNRDKLGKHDPVSELIEAQGIKPTSVLEIGCADGWRLKKLRGRYACKTWGLDPAIESFVSISNNEIVLSKGTAAALPVGLQADLVIFGFCLYLCDPCDYFRIVAESDRVLRDGGHIIIHDFDPWQGPCQDGTRRPYEHREAVFSYHVDFPRLWTSHPAYREIAAHPGVQDEYVSLLRKDLKGAFRDA